MLCRSSNDVVHQESRARWWHLTFSYGFRRHFNDTPVIIRFGAHPKLGQFRFGRIAIAVERAHLRARHARLVLLFLVWRALGLTDLWPLPRRAPRLLLPLEVVPSDGSQPLAPLRRHSCRSLLWSAAHVFVGGDASAISFAASASANWALTSVTARSTASLALSASDATNLASISSAPRAFSVALSCLSVPLYSA